MNGPMTPPDPPQVETELCDACNATGIEEGREWDGQPCAVCKGRKFVEYMAEDYDPEPQV